MAGDPAFPIELADSLTSAEMAGSLEKEAGRWSTYFQAEASQTAQVLATWLPRLLYAAVMLWMAYGLLTGAGFGPRLPLELQ
mgnify:CR=1 FL=1